MKKSHIPTTLKNKLVKFKEKHHKILSEWESMQKDADKLLFDKYCKKDYYEYCDPIYCSFYIAKDCDYPPAMRELDKIINIKEK
ncbi:MAG: hypothetical protein GWP19_02945 [Planctomycetia bacterium]|nr:hypothetical protein [Planctomycetia bacterium]